MRNGNFFKSLVSEICVIQIRVSQGVGVISTQKVCSANAAAAPESLLRQEIGPDKLFTQKSPLGRHSIFFHLNNSSHYIIYGKIVHLLKK